MVGGERSAWSRGRMRHCQHRCAHGEQCGCSVQRHFSWVLVTGRLALSISFSDEQKGHGSSGWAGGLQGTAVPQSQVLGWGWGAQFGGAAFWGAVKPYGHVDQSVQLRSVCNPGWEGASRGWNVMSPSLSPLPPSFTSQGWLLTSYWKGAESLSQALAMV